MKTPITYGQLKDQIGTPFPRPILHCPGCQAEFSANAGDYWDRPTDRVITCAGCGEDLALEQLTNPMKPTQQTTDASVSRPIEFGTDADRAEFYRKHPHIPDNTSDRDEWIVANEARLKAEIAAQDRDEAEDTIAALRQALELIRDGMADDRAYREAARAALARKTGKEAQAV